MITTVIAPRSRTVSARTRSPALGVLRFGRFINSPPFLLFQSRSYIADAQRRPKPRPTSYEAGAWLGVMVALSPQG